MSQHNHPPSPLPEVSTSTAGTIVLELEPQHAEILARVLYAYEALGASVAGSYAAGEVVEEYDADVWDPVALALLGEAATVRVPFMTAPGLRLVEGGGHA